MYLIHYQFTLRTHAGYRWPDKKNLLWVFMVVTLAAFLILTPCLTKTVSYYQQKKEDKYFNEVMYVRNPGE